MDYSVICQIAEHVDHVLKMLCTAVCPQSHILISEVIHNNNVNAAFVMICPSWFLHKYL